MGVVSRAVFFHGFISPAMNPITSAATKEIVLQQNVPNPFSDATILSYSLPEQATVRLEVFDMLNQKVATLVSNKAQSAGSYQVSFDASRLTTGTYIAIMSAVTKNGIFRKTMNMTVIR